MDLTQVSFGPYLSPTGQELAPGRLGLVAVASLGLDPLPLWISAAAKRHEKRTLKNAVRLTTTTSSVGAGYCQTCPEPRILPDLLLSKDYPNPLARRSLSERHTQPRSPFVYSAERGSLSQPGKEKSGGVCGGENREWSVALWWFGSPKFALVSRKLPLDECIGMPSKGLDCRK